jgi:hypothetical protein
MLKFQYKNGVYIMSARCSFFGQPPAPENMPRTAAVLPAELQADSLLELNLKGLILLAATSKDMRDWIQAITLEDTRLQKKLNAKSFLDFLNRVNAVLRRNNVSGTPSAIDAKHDIKRYIDALLAGEMSLPIFEKLSFPPSQRIKVLTSDEWKLISDSNRHNTSTMNAARSLLQKDECVIALAEVFISLANFIELCGTFFARYGQGFLIEEIIFSKIGLQAFRAGLITYENAATSVLLTCLLNEKDLLALRKRHQMLASAQEGFHTLSFDLQVLVASGVSFDTVERMKRCSATGQYYLRHLLTPEQIGRHPQDPDLAAPIDPLTVAIVFENLITVDDLFKIYRHFLRAREKDRDNLALLFESIEGLYVFRDKLITPLEIITTPTRQLVLFFMDNFSLLRKRHAFCVRANDENVARRVKDLPFFFLIHVVNERITLEQAEEAAFRKNRIEQDITKSVVFSQLNPKQQMGLLTGSEDGFQLFMVAPGDYVSLLNVYDRATTVGERPEDRPASGF